MCSQVKPKDELELIVNAGMDQWTHPPPPTIQEDAYQILTILIKAFLNVVNLQWKIKQKIAFPNIWWYW